MVSIKFNCNVYVGEVLKSEIVETNFLVKRKCMECPGWRPRMFGVFARTSGLSSTRGDLGESG